MGKPAAPPSGAKTTYAISALNAAQLEGNDGLVAYTFTVTRSGDTRKSGSVSYATQGAQADDFAGALSGTVEFAAGETSKQITVWVVGDSLVEADESFTVTLMNAVGGSITNASAAGTIKNDDVPPDPKLDLSTAAGWHDADQDGLVDAGETAWHTYSVHNDGNVALGAVEVHDPAIDGGGADLLTGDTDGDGLLDVGETWIFQSNHDLTQAEIDAGVLQSRANATAIGPGGQAVSDSDQLDTPLPQTPALFLYQHGWWMDGSGSGSANLIADVGELVQFTFGVINTGNVTLSDIALSDPMLEGNPLTFLEGDSNSNGALDVGEVWIYVGEYALTQADVDARTLMNFASVTGLAPFEDIVSASASRDVSLPWM